MTGEAQVTDTTDVAQDGGTPAMQDEGRQQGQADSGQTGAAQGKQVDDPKQGEAQTEPDQNDWRVKMAGGDEAELKRLERYATPSDVWKKARELEKKITSGSHLKRPDKDAPPEQLAAWRKANNIPDDPKGYKAPEGLVIGDADKPIVDAWLATAHEQNMSADQVEKSLSWYFSAQEQAMQARAERDAEFAKSAQDTLREEFGGEYRMNMNMIGAFVADLPEGIGDTLFKSRLPDGTLLGDNPSIIKWFAQKARELNPDAAIMPHIHGDKSAAIAEELAQLTKESGDTSKDSVYWRGPLAEKKQARMRELLAVQEKIKSR